tara:strand:- start:685 stop:996 length:312 start_codon:yes stop_codon:yes gene_type:complete
MTKNKLSSLVSNYIDVIKNDYLHSVNTTEYTYKTFHYAVGRKYIKVMSGSSAHSFVVNVVDDDQFRYGDILKAASFDTPARNTARGNVFEPESYKNTPWTGCV